MPRAPQGVDVLAYDGVQGADALDRLNRLIGNTPIHVEISKMYGLGDVAQAHRDVERHHLGKLAVRIS